MKKLEELGISPAPWKVEHHPEESSDEFEVFSADGNFVGPMAIGFGIPESMANLIAAAPDMYEALRELVVACGDVGYKDGGTAACYESEHRLYDVLDRANVALAKAAGESEVE